MYVTLTISPLAFGINISSLFPACAVGRNILLQQSWKREKGKGGNSALKTFLCFYDPTKTCSHCPVNCLKAHIQVWKIKNRCLLSEHTALRAESSREEALWILDLLACRMRSWKYAGSQHPPPKLGDKQQSLMNYLSHSLKARERKWVFPMSIRIKSREGKEYTRHKEWVCVGMGTDASKVLSVQVLG